MPICKACRCEKPAENFERTAVRRRSVCIDCQRSRGQRRETSDDRRVYRMWEMDDFPDQCLHHFCTTAPCQRTATHRSGQWRLCDEHWQARA